MRHQFKTPYTLRICSTAKTKNPQTFEIDRGLREARRLAKQATERGQANAAAAEVRDALGRVAFECRNIAGKVVQVSR